MSFDNYLNTLLFNQVAIWVAERQSRLHVLAALWITLLLLATPRLGRRDGLAGAAEFTHSICGTDLACRENFSSPKVVMRPASRRVRVARLHSTLFNRGI